MTRLYSYCQFVREKILQDFRKGIDRIVVVEAEDVDDADTRAKKIGLDFRAIYGTFKDSYLWRSQADAPSIVSDDLVLGYTIYGAFVHYVDGTFKRAADHVVVDRWNTVIVIR